VIVTQPDDEASVMLVGKAAEAPLPTPLTRDALDHTCAVEG
jgi:hypothetical protein